MNLLERVLTLLQANLNSVVEKADDPEKVLRQLQLDMRNQLVQVKTQVATAIAESRKLQKRSQERQTEAASWLKKAEQAVQQGNDHLARSALTHYNELNRQAHRYQQQQKEQEQQVVRMRDVLLRLEAKITEIDTTIELLASRKRSALIQQRVYEALSKNSSPKEREQAAKAQDTVQEAEARARAMADLHQRDLDEQLVQVSSEQEVEQQLQDLKHRSSSRNDILLLHGGNPHVSPLLPPKPEPGTPARKRPPSDTMRGRPSPTVTPETSKSGDIDIERLRKLLESLSSES
jgi:phage shock protein A